MIWTKDIIRESSCDVAVIGGGAAGIFAAVSAAMCGAKTVLIEKTSVLGGTITNAGVDYPGIFFAWGKQIIGGPCYDAILRLNALGGAVIPPVVYSPKYHSDMQVRIDPFLFAAVAEEICAESGVKLLYHTMIGDVRPEDPPADGYQLIKVGKEGMSVLHARRVIDCTGDACIAQMAGFAVEGNERPQPATLIHDLTGYDPEAIDREDLENQFRRALESGDVSVSDFRGRGPWSALRNRRITMHLLGTDGTTSEDRTDLEIRARKRLNKIVAFLRTVKGAEGLRVQNCRWECGVRETVTIVGETKMTVDNYLSGYVYPDAVCYAFYPVDRHTPEGIYQIFLRDGVVPTIPMGALIPKGSEHMAVAGRCVSGDKDTVSAVRVQAPCMAMGQAAGVAAALSVRAGCPIREADVHAIRSALTGIGAIIEP